MKFFIQKDHPPKLYHFREEYFPYEPHPRQPLIHGTLESGDIDWDFWKKQEIWTLAQALGLMQGYPGDAYHSLAYDSRNKEYLEKLNALIASGGAHTLFRKIETVLADIGSKKESVAETSEVYPKEFVRWAYENHFVLPFEVLDMLPAVLHNGKKAQAHKNLTINIKPYTEAWQQKIAEKSWADRRAVTAYFLAEIGFTAKQIYMALSGKGEAEADPDRQVRNWKEKGKLLVNKNIETNNFPKKF